MMRNADDSLTTKIDFRAKHRLETPHELPKISINIDKFTGFFNKFPKRNISINDSITNGYHADMSADHSDSAVRKVFRRPRICPHLR